MGLSFSARAGATRRPSDTPAIAIFNAFLIPDSFVLVVWFVLAIWRKSSPGLSWLSIEAFFASMLHGTFQQWAIRQRETDMPFSVFRKTRRPLKSGGENQIADTERNIRHGRPPQSAGRNFTFLAGRYFRDLAGIRRASGAVRAGCRALSAHRACAGHALDAGSAADDGGRGDCAAGGRLGWRSARCAV